MDCRYFGECSASICPKDADVKKATWFPNEGICRLHDIPEWVKRQRKIAKKANSTDCFFFTFIMLQRDCRIARGIKGIDPDGTEKERAEAELAWLKAHPAITGEERERMRARGEKQTALLSRFREQKTG